MGFNVSDLNAIYSNLFPVITIRICICRYFGRKRLVKKNEKWVGNSNQLVHAGYSYWTLGYALSLSGAKKLLGKQKSRFLKWIICASCLFVFDQLHSQLHVRSTILYQSMNSCRWCSINIKMKHGRRHSPIEIWLPGAQLRSFYFQRIIPATMATFPILNNPIRSMC